MQWRAFLAKLVKDPKEKLRVATALGVERFTIERWVTGAVTPRLYHLKNVPGLFPEHQTALKELIEEEFPDLWAQAPISSHIPALYYERVLQALASNERQLAAWTIFHLSMLQLQSQVKHIREIYIFKLTPPQNQCIYTCYQLTAMRGRWPNVLPLQFSGTETLAGQAIQQNEKRLSSKEIAVPFKRENGLGGCVHIRSSQPLAEHEAQLVEKYANLFALALKDDEFYPQERVQLLSLPPLDQQLLFSGLYDLTLEPDVCPPEMLQSAEQLLIRHLSTKEPKHAE
jgi:hypothetical protein